MLAVLALFAATLLAGCGPAVNATDQAIIAATQQYLNENAQIGAVMIRVQQVEDPFARVLISPESDDAESATAFLKRENDRWEILTIGTAFDRETYDEFAIPPALRV